MAPVACLVWASPLGVAVSNYLSERSAVYDLLLTINTTVVLAMSIWNDAAQNMAWLDAGGNGPCTDGEGSPDNIKSQHPDTHVVFSNIRWGDIGSTTSG